MHRRALTLSGPVAGMRTVENPDKPNLPTLEMSEPIDVRCTFVEASQSRSSLSAFFLIL